jgi:hypothetical protein
MVEAAERNDFVAARPRADFALMSINFIESTLP